MRGQGQKARVAGVRDRAPESLVLQDREDAAFCRQSGASVGFQRRPDSVTLLKDHTRVDTQHGQK